VVIIQIPPMAQIHSHQCQRFQLWFLACLTNLVTSILVN
jgi:hypothetical protein